ncbi:MAG: hypothetical protein NZ898_12645 [Myxococcota bacterium]|nr:hypothetical protein [Myxococcota bacterium]MDW8361809.1 hypothetical protein [Myxococcales bacterium]
MPRERSLAFVAIASFTLWLAPLHARADRVVLLPPRGDVGDHALGEIEEALAQAVRDAGHLPLTELGVGDPASTPPPVTANELRAIAEMQNAAYVLYVEARTAEGGERMAFRAGYAPLTRMEEIELYVPRGDRARRLREVVAALLRPQGLGEEAARLMSEDERARAEQARLEEERRRAEERERAEREERARREAEERARREREEREARAAEEARRWEERERYGDRGAWMVGGGLDLRAILSAPRGRGGSALGGVSGRVGRRIARGWELRGVVDLVTGASSAIAFGVGGVFFYSPLADHPLFVGGSAEAGLHFATTGNRVASFLLRIAPVVGYRLGGVYFEVAAAEIGWLSANDGVTTLGLSARAAVRF